MCDLFVRFAKASTCQELWQEVETVSAEVGLVHARATIYDLNSIIDPLHFKHLRSYPDDPNAWGPYYLKERMYDHDRSFHLIFEHATEHMYWTKMASLTRKGTQAHRVFEEMLNFGIGEGILVGHSSLILKHTLLLGLAGPSSFFDEMKKNAEQEFISVCQVFCARYLKLALAEDLVQPADGVKFIRFSNREREILRQFSHGKTAEETAEILNITPGTVHKHVDRMKKKAPISREGLVALALRTGQIH